MSWSSTPPGTCPPPIAIRTPNIWPGHLPGAVFFDIDAIADTAINLPHMLPAPNDFARMVGALGISENMTIVIYDELGLFSAPRAWWTFKTMGARDVRILEGGGAQMAGRAPRHRNRAGEPPAAHLPRPSSIASRVADYETVRDRSHDRAAQIADARPAARFNARSPRATSRPALAAISPIASTCPWPCSPPMAACCPLRRLQTLFAEHQVDLGKPIITSLRLRHHRLDAGSGARTGRSRDSRGL